MAIIQISKIQQRSGNLVDLPQLDEAQFGWASDAKRLFIGKTTPNENIEVLTSYSNISFSQIDGSGGANFNISTPTNGQVLTYVSSTNTWDNWPNTDVLNANASFKLNLGDVGNIRMDGGSTGFVLQTDGLGNLSWTPKTTIVANIVALSNATPIVMKVSNSIPYTNGTEITISGVNGASNSAVNSQNFYVKLAGDFPTSGNVSLYTDSGLTTGAVGTGLTYTNSPNALAITTVGGTSTLVAAGSNTNIQFNNGGTLTGSPYFTILNGNGLLTHTGPYFAAGNVYANSGTIGASLLTGTVTTNAQPNITSTGTLASLSVSGNTNVGNLNTAGLVSASQVSANSNGLGTNFKVGDDAYIGDINVVNTLTIKGQQDGTQGYIVFGNTNTTNYIGRNGSNAITVTGAFSVTGNANVGNIGGAAGVFTTVAGSLTTAAQPNITSLGTLTSLSVSGNANVGNIGATNGVFTNVSGNGSALSSITGANVTGAVAYATTANSVAGANVSGAVTYATTANSVAGANVTGAVAYATTANSVAGANVSGAVAYATTANAVAGANVSGTVSSATSATTAGTVTTAAQPNITSVSTSFTSLTFANAQTISGNNMTLTTGANTNAGTITGNWSLSTGSKLQATYADLAEYYEADALYEPGTVLAFGGGKEVTIAEDGTTRVAGVVSTNPAYAMNANCQGIATAIALQGRVPTKVRGKIRKGDMMVSAGNGYARPSNSPQMGTVIGKALENFDGVEGVIEIVVGRL